MKRDNFTHTLGARDPQAHRGGGSPVLCAIQRAKEGDHRLRHRGEASTDVPEEDGCFAWPGPAWSGLWSWAAPQSAGARFRRSVLNVLFVNLPAEIHRTPRPQLVIFLSRDFSNIFTKTWQSITHTASAADSLFWARGRGHGCEEAVAEEDGKGPQDEAARNAAKGRRNGERAAHHGRDWLCQKKNVVQREN